MTGNNRQRSGRSKQSDSEKHAAFKDSKRKPSTRASGKRATKLTKPGTKPGTTPAPEAVNIAVPDASWTRDRLLAKIAVDGTLANADTIQRYASGQMGQLGSMTQGIDSLQEKIKASKAGSTAVADELMIGQTIALNAIFNELMRRAAMNIADYPEAAERYMRLAFKAQNQSRSTLESLARVKNPPNVAFVRQANIAHGPQQVNNGSPPPPAPSRVHTQENQNKPIELLENNHGEWVEPGATHAAGACDPAVAAVGEVHWPKDRGRQG